MKKFMLFLMCIGLLALAGNSLGTINVFDGSTGLITGWTVVSAGQGLVDPWDGSGLGPILNSIATTTPAQTTEFGLGTGGGALVWDAAQILCTVRNAVQDGAYVGFRYQAPAGQVITGVTISEVFISLEPLTMTVQITDAAGVVKSQAVRASSGDWVQNLSATGLNTSAIDIRYANTGTGTWAATEWPGNGLIIKSVEVTTAPLAPVCGDTLHPYPIGDLDQDCLVNLADFAELALHWMENSMIVTPPEYHLTQFGYYHVAVNGIGTGDYINDVNGFTNFNFMDWSAANAVKAAACNPPQKMAVNLRWVFFSGSGLNPNYVSIWNSYAAQMAPYLDVIGAFYIMDEPYWAGISKADLETAAKLCKDTFPQIPTMVVEAGIPEVINGSWQMPSYIDYYGVDHYYSFDDIPGLLAIIKSQQLPGQKFFLVPQNILGASHGGTDAQVASWAYDYYNLALSDDTMVALMVFLWPDISTPGDQELALAGPLTLAAFQDIGGQILSGATPKIFFAASYTVSQGTYSSGNAASVKNYDAGYLVVNSAANLATTDFTVTGVSIAAPSKIKVRVNTKSSVASTTQAIQFWNYSTSAWDSKDSATIGTAVSVRDITVTTGASNYISGGILKVRVAGSKTSAFVLSHEQIAVLTYN